MKLVYEATGTTLEVPEEQVEDMLAHGFVNPKAQAEAPKKAAAPRKRAPKKPEEE